MKTYYLLPLILCFLVADCLSAQTDESTLPPEVFSINDPGLESWKAYFEDNFFSQGIPPDSLEEEGTGYLPYFRAQWFYDLRKDIHGDAGGLKRWEIFRQIRAQSLGRNGPMPAADWQSVGPTGMEEQGGRMISHAFDPFDSQVIWAGSASGGLWLTEDSGENWQPMTDQIPSTGVGAIAVNPQNSQSVLIGTGEGYNLGSLSILPGLGVFKSNDRGMTWLPTQFNFQQSAGVSGFKLVWSYADTNVVWLAATNGLWKSIDAGQTWVLKKGDGTNQQTAICTDLLQHPTDPDLLYSAFEANGIWKSADGGENWVKLAGGLPTSNINLINIDLCRSQPEVLYASISSGQASNFNLKGLYRSNNAGATWTKIPMAPEAFCPPGFTACQGWYDNVVAVSPADPEMVWFGGVTLWRSTNGGINWTQHDRYTCQGCAEPPLCRTYVDQHDFAFDPQNPEIVYAFNDGGIFRSINGGDCWEPRNQGLVTAQFYAIASGRSDPGTIVGGMQDHGLQGIKLSENTGLAWDRWGFFDGSDVEVHGANANILYGGWVDGTYRRTNGGVHTLATQITNGINLTENNGFFLALLRQHPNNHLTLLGETSQRLYKTINGGGLWTPVASISGTKVFEFDQNDPNFAYAAAWSNTGAFSFWRSQDGGDSWAPTPANPGWRVTDIKSSPLQAGLIYASRNSINANIPHVYKSADFGDHWTAIQGDLPDLPVNAIAVHPFVPGVVFAATDLGVFITIDDGATWTEYNDNLPVNYTSDIEFNPADTTLRIGTLGRGAWITRAWMPEDVTSAKAPIVQRSFGILNLAPNPAGSTVWMNYFLENPANIELAVLNIMGQKVAILYAGKQLAGEYSTSWDRVMTNGIQAKAGIYYVRLIVGQEAAISKLICR